MSPGVVAPFSGGAMGSVADRGDSRITIELDAVAQFPGGRSWPCVIRDFCGDGMLRARWAAREIMPLRPAVLAATFDDAMQALELDREIRRLFCGFFQESLISFLRRLIPAL
ncbi:MAG: hypothetical protein VX766_18020 [Pseudomonadota bacterium]|nr:hypothetical protein [Pseudomonadota bacterium]